MRQMPIRHLFRINSSKSLFVWKTVYRRGYMCWSDAAVAAKDGTIKTHPAIDQYLMTIRQRESLQRSNAILPVKTNLHD